MKDYELQERIERGMSAEDRDGQAYKVVFDALGQKPGFTLPAQFADRVTAAIRARYSSRDMAWFIAGILLFVVALVVSILLTGFSFNLGAFAFLSGYPGLVAFGAAFVMGLHWVDHKWIRKTSL